MDAGKVLDKYEEQYIEEVFQDIDEVKSLVERNPEYKKLLSEIMTMWNDIIRKNIENHKKT